MLRKIILTTLIIAIIGLAANYYYVHRFDRVIKGNYPIDKIEFNINTIIVHISNGAEISDVFNLQLFNGATPFLSKEQIITKLGKANASEFIDDANVDTYYTKYGKLLIGNVFNELTNFEFCHFYTANLKYSQFLKPSTLNILPKDLSNKIIVAEIEDEGDFQVRLSDENEDVIYWTTD